MGEFGVVFQNEPVDVSEEFSRQENHFFVGEKVEEFDPEGASGRLYWKSLSLKQRVSYHQITTQFEDYKVWEDLPSGGYEDDRALPFDLSFVTPRTVRLRLAARPEGCRGESTLILVDEPPIDDSWHPQPLRHHRRGGFSYATPEDLYRRWLAFGVLTSHSRCNGTPPTEPWEYGEEFTGDFRRMVELRYRLMPYVYAQAALACRERHPMLRTLFFEYPEDRTSWLVEDQYFFGTNILVAPLMEEARSRDVYLPLELWGDYQGGETYEGDRWHHVHAGEVLVVMLVRDGAAIPHARLAQSTERIEWGEIELRVLGTGNTAEGYFCYPEDGGLHVLRLVRRGDGFELEEDPSNGRVNWTIHTAS